MSLPAAKRGDYIISLDVHIVMIPSPSGTVPSPLPHPFNGTIDDNVSKDVNMMGQPAAVLGSTATNNPAHIPTPPGTAFQKPPSNKAKILTGSTCVFIDGKPAARASETALTCNDPSDIPNGKVIVPTSTVFVGGSSMKVSPQSPGVEAEESASGLVEKRWS